MHHTSNLCLLESLASPEILFRRFFLQEQKHVQLSPHILYNLPFARWTLRFSITPYHYVHWNIKNLHSMQSITERIMHSRRFLSLGRDRIIRIAPGLFFIATQCLGISNRDLLNLYLKNVDIFIIVEKVFV